MQGNYYTKVQFGAWVRPYLRFYYPTTIAAAAALGTTVKGIAAWYSLQSMPNQKQLNIIARKVGGGLVLHKVGGQGVIATYKHKGTN